MDQVFAGSATNKGKNDYNEDRFVILRPLPEDPTTHFLLSMTATAGPLLQLIAKNIFMRTS